MSPRKLKVVLRELREERGWSQAELAERAKVTDAYVAQLETGAKQNPSLLVLKRIAIALDVPLQILLPEPMTLWKAEERLDAPIFATREKAEGVARKIGSRFVWRLQEKAGEFIQRGRFPIRNDRHQGRPQSS